MLNPLRQLARHAPRPLDGALMMYEAVLSDMLALPGGLPSGNDLDEWDPEHIERTLPLMRAVYGNYFRGEVRGLENIPEGPALLVGNHSGGTMIADTFVFTFEFYNHFGPQRRFHQLAHSVAARMPGLAVLRRYGTVVASHDNARRAFEVGAPVLVYPGGDYETFRPSWHSDQIEFGGRQGFIRLAMEYDVPIVPVVAIGGQETALFLTRGQRASRFIGLDRLARIKVLPVALAPPFGISVLDLPTRIPLPAKITVEVLPPIDLKERFTEEPDVDHIYEQVTTVMQEALTDLSAERDLPLVG